MAVPWREANDSRWKHFYDTHMLNDLTSLSLYYVSSLSAWIYGVMFDIKLFDA